MKTPDIETARCIACGWRRDPITYRGQTVGFRCPNCRDTEEIQ